MKKIYALVLALCMAFSLSVASFADAPTAATQTSPGISSSGGSDTTEVKRTIFSTSRA